MAKNGRIWFDRGLIDGVAYLQRAGKSLNGRTPHRIKQFASIPFDAVFLIENLGHCRNNQVREESHEEALELGRLQYQNYSDAGYSPIIIPMGPLEQRVEKILESI